MACIRLNVTAIRCECNQSQVIRPPETSGHWILFSNSVIVAPYERPNRKLREKD